MRGPPAWKPLNPAFTKKNRLLTRVKPTNLDDEAHMGRLLQDKKFRRLLFSGPSPWERTLAISAEFPPPSRPIAGGDLMATLVERWDDVISRPAVYDRVLLAFQGVSLHTLSDEELSVLERFIRKVIYRLAHGKLHWRVTLAFAQFARIVLLRHACIDAVAEADVDMIPSQQLHAAAMAAAAAVGGLTDTASSNGAGEAASNAAYDAAFGVSDDHFVRVFDVGKPSAYPEDRMKYFFNDGSSPTRTAANDTMSDALDDGLDDMGGDGDGVDGDGTSSSSPGAIRGATRRRPRRHGVHDVFDVPLALRGVSTARSSSLRRLRAAEHAEATYAISTPLGGLTGKPPDDLFGGMGLPAAGLPLPAAAAGPRASSSSITSFLAVLYYGVDVVAARIAAIVEASPDSVDDAAVDHLKPWNRLLRVTSIITDIDRRAVLPSAPSPAAADAAPPGEEVSPDRVVPGRLRPLAVRLLEMNAARAARQSSPPSTASIPGDHSASTPRPHPSSLPSSSSSLHTASSVDGAPSAEGSSPLPDGPTTTSPWAAYGAASAPHALFVWGGVPSAYGIAALTARSQSEGSVVPRHLVASAMSNDVMDGSGMHGSDGRAQQSRVQGIHATGASHDASSSFSSAPSLLPSVDRLLTAAAYVGGVRSAVLTGLNIMNLLESLVSGYYANRVPAPFVEDVARGVAQRISLSTVPPRLDYCASLAFQLTLLGIATKEQLSTLVVAWTGLAVGLGLCSDHDPAMTAGKLLWSLARVGRADPIAFGRVSDSFSSTPTHPLRRRPHIQARNEMTPDDLAQPHANPLIRSSSPALATMAWAMVAGGSSLSPNSRPGGGFWRVLFFACSERQRLQHMTAAGPGTHLTLPAQSVRPLRPEDVAMIGWSFAVTGQLEYAAQLLEPLVVAMPLMHPDRFPPLAAAAFEWSWRLIVNGDTAAVTKRFVKGPLVRARVACAALFCGVSVTDELRGVTADDLLAALMERDARFGALVSEPIRAARSDATLGAAVSGDGAGGPGTSGPGTSVSVSSSDTDPLASVLDCVEDAFAAFHLAFGSLSRAAHCARDLFAWCGIAGDYARAYRRDRSEAPCAIPTPPAGLLGGSVELLPSVGSIPPPSLPQLVGNAVASDWPQVTSTLNTVRGAIPRPSAAALRAFGHVEAPDSASWTADVAPALVDGALGASAFSDTHIDSVGDAVDRFDSRLRISTTAIWPHARSNLRTGDGLSDVEAGEAAVAARVAKEAAAAASAAAEADFAQSRWRLTQVKNRFEGAE